MRTIDQMVRQEVIYCVSSLVSEMLSIQFVGMKNLTDKDGFQDFCESNNLEPHQNEALEHWIVSGWLADKLLEKNEMVLKDFMGLTIWGRTTSGQSITMDAVIQDIYGGLK